VSDPNIIEVSHPSILPSELPLNVTWWRRLVRSPSVNPHIGRHTLADSR